MLSRMLLVLGLTLLASCSGPGAGGDGGPGDDGAPVADDGGILADELGADGDDGAPAADDGGPGDDGGNDGDGEGDGAADPCAGLSPCACVERLLDEPDPCRPDRQAILEQRAREIIEARKAPCAAAGRAVFLYFGQANSVEVAGEFNAWTPEPLGRICALDLWARQVELSPARYEYKLIIEGTWRLDPANRAFAYDDFAANPDGKNSVVNFPDSGQSHLEWWPGIISNELGNGRDIIVHVPAGYRPEEARTYPALYLHDGQNVFDDGTCCFGNGGWWVNRAADQEVVFGNVEPFFAVGIANTESRLDEYTPCVDQSQGEPFGGKAEAYERFLLETVIPLMEDAYRLDPAQRSLAGSSLGGTISMFIGLRHPDLFRRGIGSMSGAFWVCQGTQQAVRDQVAALAGRLDLPIYLDSGGDPQTNDDGAADTLEVRDLLQAKGFSVFDAGLDQPCDENADACYHLEPGAPHNEIAWRERVWRMIRFLE